MHHVFQSLRRTKSNGDNNLKSIQVDRQNLDPDNKLTEMLLSQKNDKRNAL